MTGADCSEHDQSPSSSLVSRPVRAMTTRLTLVCHAATTATRAARFPAGDPLEDGALRHVPTLRRRFADADRCWTSPVPCAVETAAALQLTATAEPALRDIDHGRWSGRRLIEVEAEEPGAIQVWLQDPGAAPHGGESMLELLARVGDWLDAHRTTPGRVAAVPHPAVIRAAVVDAIEATPASFWRIDVAPLSLTTLSGSHGRWTLGSIGRVRDDP